MNYYLNFYSRSILFDQNIDVSNFIRNIDILLDHNNHPLFSDQIKYFSNKNLNNNSFYLLGSYLIIFLFILFDLISLDSI